MIRYEYRWIIFILYRLLYKHLGANNMKTTTKQQLLIALLLMSLYTSLAQAWTFTTSGIIDSGTDYTRHSAPLLSGISI